MRTLLCTCSIFTAASASVVYLSFGGFPADYAVLTFLVGLIFTIIGQVGYLYKLSSSAHLFSPSLSAVFLVASS